MGAGAEYDDPDAIEEDFSASPEARTYDPAPPGQYLARIIDVDPSKDTGAGDRMWGLRMELAGRVVAAAGAAPPSLVFHDDAGMWKGRTVWDNVVFSAKAKPRVKLIFARLYLDCSRRRTYTPSQLLGRWAIITIEIGETSAGKPRNNVTYSGYAAAPAEVVLHLLTTKQAPLLIREREAGGETPF
jgi:hypothetical protein